MGGIEVELEGKSGRGRRSKSRDFGERGENGGGTIRRIEAAKRMALSDYDSWVAGARPEVKPANFFLKKKLQKMFSYS